MDQFFKFLREIQRKERTNSSLSKVGNDFYIRTHKYLDELKTELGNDPFSNEHYLLKDTQRIATEICERREHKITDAAVINIQRSYHLFKGKSKFNLLDTTPLNLTKEEEKLYFSLIDNLKKHRESISLDEFTENLKEDVSLTKENNNKKKFDEISPKDRNIEKNSLKQDNNIKNLNTSKSEIKSDDKILNRLNDIKEAKVIEDEKYENIDKQINKSSNENIQNSSDGSDFKNKLYNKSQNKNFSKYEIKSSKKFKNKETPASSDDLINIFTNEDDQFINLDDEDVNIEELSQNNNKNNKNTSSKKNKSYKIINDTLLVFNEIDSIVGVDKKIYGPFYPQDIVVMPDANAKIFIKNKKGRLIKI